MNRTDRHNAAAMRDGQFAYDNAEPPCDDGREEYIAKQAGYLMIGWDSDDVSFMPSQHMPSFAMRAAEHLATNDDELMVAQMVIALLNHDTEQATAIANRFQPALAELAEEMVTTALENRA